MNLWVAALRHTAILQNPNGPALIDLFPLAISLLALNLDLLGKAINILDAYLLLDAVLVLQVPPLMVLSVRTLTHTVRHLPLICSARSASRFPVLLSQLT